MFRNIAFSSIAVLMLASCSGMVITLPATTPVIPPSPAPSIHSPTPPFASTATSSPTLSIITITPTSEFTQTASPTPTVTPPPPILALDILGCNTSEDILHGMGEVTNAYPLIQNKTGVTLTNVCATLSATDEGRVHPDKTVCVPSLSSGYQVILKLTVDTTLNKDTAIRVDVSSRQGYTAIPLTRPSCKDIGLPGEAPANVGLVQPIP